MVQPIRPDPFLRARQEDRGGSNRTAQSGPMTVAKAKRRGRMADPLVDGPEADAVDSDVEEQGESPKLRGMPASVLEADTPVTDRPLGRPYETFSELHEREAIEQELEHLNGRLQRLSYQAAERQRIAHAHGGLLARHPELGEAPTAFGSGMDRIQTEIRSIRDRVDRLQRRFNEVQRQIRRNRRKYTGKPARLV
ncbi:MAG TPA: hypothetical protein RMG48_06050 [Myxococcales bacterium LLY-WYZ-16_1]|nr:hypothetical protein [Myxococcales bacterium LLY-WYZ-16_1]